MRTEEAYVRLLRSVLRREKELFPSAEEVIAQWRLFDKALSSSEKPGFTGIDAGVDIGMGVDNGVNTWVNPGDITLVKYPVGSSPEHILELHRRRQTNC